MQCLLLSAALCAFSAVLPATAQDIQSVTDAMGQTVNLPPGVERITVVDPLNSLEALLSLGVAPSQIGQRPFVAEWTGDPLKQWPWLEQRLADLGADPLRMNGDFIDLETIAAASPDLVLVNQSWFEDNRALLEEIAPVVATPMASVRDTITLYGQVFDMEPEAEAVLAAWDARIASELGGLAPDGATVAVMRTDDVGTFAVFNVPGTYGALDLMLQAGFSLPPAIADAGRDYHGLGASFSLERLDVLAEADVIVVLGFSPEPTADFLADPLAQSVPAIAEGRVVMVEQGPVAQAIAMMSPLNFNVVLPVAQDAASLAAGVTP
jgi:iron complex transport system substrate-binding protein